MERREGSAGVSKSAEARAENAELKSTHHLSPVLTFIVHDCSAIFCALVHCNFYSCLLSKAASYLLLGIFGMWNRPLLFSAAGALCLLCLLLQEYWGPMH